MNYINLKIYTTNIIFPKAKKKLPEVFKIFLLASDFK